MGAPLQALTCPPSRARTSRQPLDQESHFPNQGSSVEANARGGGLHELVQKGGAQQDSSAKLPNALEHPVMCPGCSH